MSAQKAIVLGDVAVGKTAILRRYLFDDFVTEHNTTMAHEFSMKMLPGGHRLQLWDSVGQERFTSLTQTYFRNAQIIMVIYSVNVRKSFELAQYWINQAREQINTDYKMFLVANKCDLPTRDVKYEEGKGMADDNGIPYFEISAKTKLGMKELFSEVEQIAIAFALKEKPNEIITQTIPKLEKPQKKKGLCG